ncbi:hypothetical protein IWX90DRAFT_252562 [Phyllosticta citrichinensis]|uniref:Uncharacterized protein n=1 Tax=Phyllosticta citrichinensis TaxID=1130410 RepID=A0ABR1XR87_9PEZI
MRTVMFGLAHAARQRVSASSSKRPPPAPAPAPAPASSLPTRQHLPKRKQSRWSSCAPIRLGAAFVPSLRGERPWPLGCWIGGVEAMRLISTPRPSIVFAMGRCRWIRMAGQGQPLIRAPLDPIERDQGAALELATAECHALLVMGNLGSACVPKHPPTVWSLCCRVLSRRRRTGVRPG